MSMTFTKMYDLSYREELKSDTGQLRKHIPMKMAMSIPKVMKKKLMSKEAHSNSEKEMDSVVREIFAEYPDSVLHYKPCL